MWPDRVDGSTGSARLDDALRDDVRGLLDAGRNATLHYGVDGQRRGEGLDVFVESFAPPPRMIVFGAIDFAAAVAQIGSFLGFRVTVCDARPVFATASRPGGERGGRRVAAPVPGRGGERADRRAHGAVRAHPRPQVRRPAAGGRAAAAEVAYIGAMGSRRTHDDRRERLLERGLTEAELARMSSPIGLDLGGAHAGGDGRVDRRGDDRHALGRRGPRLAERAGPIHKA